MDINFRREIRQLKVKDVVVQFTADNYAVVAFASNVSLDTMQRTSFRIFPTDFSAGQYAILGENDWAREANAARALKIAAEMVADAVAEREATEKRRELERRRREKLDPAPMDPSLRDAFERVGEPV